MPWLRFLCVVQARSRMGKWLFCRVRPQAGIYTYMKRLLGIVPPWLGSAEMLPFFESYINQILSHTAVGDAIGVLRGRVARRSCSESASTMTALSDANWTRRYATEHQHSGIRIPCLQDPVLIQASTVVEQPRKPPRGPFCGHVHARYLGVGPHAGACWRGSYAGCVARGTNHS